MNNAVFGRTIKNVRKHRNNKPITRKRRRNFSVSKPNYHITKFFTENFLVKKNEKNSNIDDLIILHMIKIVMYEFWYNYVQPKNGENAKICYMDIDNFIVLVKTVDFCEDTTEDVETMN